MFLDFLCQRSIAKYIRTISYYFPKFIQINGDTLSGTKSRDEVAGKSAFVFLYLISDLDIKNDIPDVSMPTTATGIEKGNETTAAVFSSMYSPRSRWAV